MFLAANNNMKSNLIQKIEVLLDFSDDEHKLAALVLLTRVQDDEEFWKHEWEKHGSCMFVEMDEFGYFSKTLELFNFG